ncbi:KGGVGR-motif variant AAA ATPase [Bdellovibrio bacteriovorus]
MRTFRTHFTTFYSYKGGVGRTSALVNSALLRAISGDRVVVIDFDLEAPGMWSYVKNIAEHTKSKVELDNRSGVLEYLYDNIKGAQPTVSLKKSAISCEDLGLKLDGKIWFIGAGNTSDSEYSKKLNSLNWTEIFERSHGELILENFKKQIIAEFDGPDYVFIDSRTGITEVGGICTRYLADLVVTLSSLNDQNILGTSKIVKAFKKAQIPTILVASNVPVGLPWGENQIFTERISFFKKYFESKPDLLIYHYPSLSLKETLPALYRLANNDSVLKEDPLLNSYENLSNHIDDRNHNSFEVFLKRNIITFLFAYDNDKQGKLNDAFVFFEKHYSNRKPLLKFLKALSSILKIITGTKVKDLLDADNLKSLDEIKKFKTKNLISEIAMLKQFTLDRASSEIIAYVEAHYKDLEVTNKEWFSVLIGESKIRALELLNEWKQFDFVYNEIPSESHAFALFAKAYAAENLGKIEESIVLYKKFCKGIEDDITDIEHPGVALGYAFASFKGGNLNLAKTLLKRAQNIATSGDEDELFFFIPQLSKRSDKDEFMKAINDLGIAIEKAANN